MVSVPGTTVTAFGGGLGGSRDYSYSLSPGGAGGSGGGGASGCQKIGGVFVGCSPPDTRGGVGMQGNAGGQGWMQGADAGCRSAGGGGGGFGQNATGGSDCLAGNGGDGYQLPFAPLMSQFVAGGGAGALTCYSTCPTSEKFGKNGQGQMNYGGGGQGGCNDAYGDTPPSICDAQNGRAGAVFISFPASYLSSSTAASTVAPEPSSSAIPAPSSSTAPAPSSNSSLFPSTAASYPSSTTPASTVAPNTTSPPLPTPSPPPAPTESKIIVVLVSCLCVFIAVLSFFKIFATLKKRKADLEEKGIRPTFQHLIFYQTALASAVSLQPLIGAQSGPHSTRILSQNSFSTLPKPSPRAIL